MISENAVQVKHPTIKNFNCQRTMTDGGKVQHDIEPTIEIAKEFFI